MSEISEGVARPVVSGSLPALGLSALGVVFGDIGTSPLYTLKTVLGMTGGTPEAATVLGVLSLVIWTLVVVTTLKYVAVAMSVDNDGEGGILALLSLLAVKRQHRLAVVAVGLFGAALIYGDGAITPAISVLSALEGLNIAVPAFAPYVLPAAVLTHRLVRRAVTGYCENRPDIRADYGVMVCFYCSAWPMGVAQHPSVFAAIDP